jgi:hypothetical protein
MVNVPVVVAIFSIVDRSPPQMSYNRGRQVVISAQHHTLQARLKRANLNDSDISWYISEACLNRLRWSVAPLLMPQGLYRIHIRRSIGRVQSKRYTHRRTDTKGQHQRAACNCSGMTAEVGYEKWNR